MFEVGHFRSPKTRCVLLAMPSVRLDVDGMLFVLPWREMVGGDHWVCVLVARADPNVNVCVRTVMGHVRRRVECVVSIND